MKEIIFHNPHRKKHFEFFKSMANPHFGVTANVDITHFYHFIKANQISFTPAVVYLISKTANRIEQFRWRIRGEKVVEHDFVHPSFTVPTAQSDVFSFCQVDFADDAVDFVKRARTHMDLMKTEPSLEDEPGRDDLLFLSANPWVHFTAMQHPMHAPAIDSVPRIVWGKYRKTENAMEMPLSVYAHHGVVDGKHLSYFFELFQKFLNDSSWLENNK